MNGKKSYPEEIFAWRLARYRKQSRTKLAHQVELETCQRIHTRLARPITGLRFPDDFRPAGLPLQTQDDRLPANLFDRAVFEPASRHLALVGASGRVVLDETVCKVAAAKYFLAQVQQDSCGECTLCRVGTQRLGEILDRIATGSGQLEDISLLEALSTQLESMAQCALGKSAAKPILTTVRAWRSEYKEHILQHHCRAGTCRFEAQADPPGGS